MNRKVKSFEQTITTTVRSAVSRPGHRPTIVLLLV